MTTIRGRRIMLLVVAALVATLLINMLYNAVSNAYLTQISYTEFKELMAEDKISEVSFKSDDRLIILTKEEAAKKSQKKYYYTGLIPNQDTTELTDEFDRLGIAYNTELPEEISPVIAFVITWVVPSWRFICCSASCGAWPRRWAEAASEASAGSAKTKPRSTWKSRPA